MNGTEANGKGGYGDMKAVGYVRVSSEKQAREGVSLDNQRSRIEAYCRYGGDGAQADKGADQESYGTQKVTRPGSGSGPLWL